MKFFTRIFFLALAGAHGQVPATPNSTAPNTSSPSVAKPAATATAPETVIAIIEGKKLTYGELQSYLSALDPQRQKLALQDRPELIRQYALMKHLVAIAEQAKLDQRSPYKEALASSRLQVLTNAQVNEEFLKIPVTHEDQLKFYGDNKDRYTEVKLKVIYLGFVANTAAPAVKGKTFRTEAEAKAKIEGLRKEALDGADFGQLVKQYSEDEKSKSQNGEFGTLRRSDNLPEEIRAVVFQLKKGEVSEPVRQRSGYYLFQAEEVGLRPFEQVETDIFNELKNARMREWLDKLAKSIPVKIEDESFMKASGAALPNPPAAR